MSIYGSAVKKPVTTILDPDLRDGNGCRALLADAAAGGPVS